MNRRHLLLSGLGASAALAGQGQAATGDGRSPRSAHAAGFLWGSAGAAYQIEGGNVASDLWVMEHVQPTIFRERSGDAADTYNRVEEDVALAASLGFNAHRFSIEWARIEPEPGQISLAAIAYYRKVFESIRRHGMTPVVTLHHFTSPRWFAAAGGFEVREGIDPFVRYVEIVSKHLGDLFGPVVTFNEPNLGGLLSWGALTTQLRPIIQASRQAAARAVNAEHFAPLVLGDFRLQTPIIIEAHERAREVIRRETGGRVPVGLSLAVNDERAGGPDARIEAKLEDALLPWLRAEGDFVGVQNYTYSLVGADKDLPNPDGVELTQMNYPFAPEALEGAVRLVAKYWNKPIYVTENGVATEDDARRVAFIDRAVPGVFACMRDGIDVRGYIHWSLLDNWEWFAGFGPKFGLVSVDRTTFQRTPKPSAAHLGRIARAGLPRDLRS
ncbi:family 1 glycosylhydrolase [Brevundimonas sp.]|uniref:glycoside hydrolase family 1 protein n=1 Tax=Brevundimonas sp. TaxID=1871086 RepID=UPI001AD3A21E|nr:family 1 glycosylhydrolase [Brevundimonas sp.]MBN9465155.1 glycoside hydrolase family 1 protein [Brevundimonas sp.]